jgi:hypothetical protein
MRRRALPRQRGLQALTLRCHRLAGVGRAKHLSPTRSNGLAALLGRIRQRAAQAVQAGEALATAARR